MYTVHYRTMLYTVHCCTLYTDVHCTLPYNAVHCTLLCGTVPCVTFCSLWRFLRPSEYLGNTCKNWLFLISLKTNSLVEYKCFFLFFPAYGRHLSHVSCHQHQQPQPQTLPLLTPPLCTMHPKALNISKAQLHFLLILTYYIYIYGYVTLDTWHMTCDTWHVTPETWHVTCDTWWGVNILSKFQLPSSNGLGSMMSWKLGKKDHWVC